MPWISDHLQPILDSVIYSFLGLLIMVVSFWLIEWIVPFSVRKEIEEDQNISLGLILAAFIIGIAIIVSTAIR